MKNEVVVLSNDINVITAEINAYQRVAGEAIFQIGRRLKHAKENDLIHGEWERWLKEDAKISPGQARKFITIADEFGGNRSTWNDIGVQALYLIATMPEPERTKEHELDSGKTKTPDEMTVAELREVKSKLSTAEKESKKLAAELAKSKQNESQAHTLADKERLERSAAVARIEEYAAMVARLERQITEAEAMPRDTEKVVDDSAIKELSKQLFDAQRKLEQAEERRISELNDLRTASKENESVRKQYIEEDLKYIADSGTLTKKIRSLRIQYGWLANEQIYKMPERMDELQKTVSELDTEIAFMKQIRDKLSGGNGTIIDM